MKKAPDNLRLAFKIIRISLQCTGCDLRILPETISQIERANYRCSTRRVLNNIQVMCPELELNSADEVINYAKGIVRKWPSILYDDDARITPEERRAFLIWKYNTGYPTKILRLASGVNEGSISNIGGGHSISREQMGRILAPYDIPSVDALLAMVQRYVKKGMYHVPTNAEYEERFPEGWQNHVREKREKIYLDGFEQAQAARKQKLLDALDGRAEKKGRAL